MAIVDSSLVRNFDGLANLNAIQIEGRIIVSSNNA